MMKLRTLLLRSRSSVVNPFRCLAVKPTAASEVAEGHLPDFTPLRTNIPTIYTCVPLEPRLELDYISNRANILFKQVPKYIAPKDLSYELPRDGLPEFAFVGRSNVGKSTLIAELLGAQGLVKVSKSPGCTQNINYFAFQSKGKNVRLTYLVDLPGYGYARASKTDRQNWSNTMEKFLQGRDCSVLRRVYLLVDSRRGVNDADKKMMTMLNKAGLSYQIIITKSDTVSGGELQIAIQSVFESMKGRGRHGCFPFVHAISAKSGMGIADLKRDICRVVYREQEVVTDDESTDDEEGNATHIQA